MSDVLIRAEGVSKKFCMTLRHSMSYGLQDIGMNLFNRFSESQELRPAEFWSLKDVSFELRRGECLGLIGPNGAGKSTLLKILNGILAPDTGRIELSGRVAALIELGAGFHPQLTGRENIYINGAILGLSKVEIDGKLDEIIEFSELGDFIDTPVKFYSSGMYVRLGFAVASQVEPDILLIDEVLAVGDVGFRAKCYNRISDLLDRCAVIVISHDMTMISRIASYAHVINKGHTVFAGNTEEAIQHYFREFQALTPKTISNGCNLESFYFSIKPDDYGYSFATQDSITITVLIDSEIEENDINLRLCFINISGEFVAEWNNLINDIPMQLIKGRQSFTITLDKVCLNPGRYYLSLVVNGSNNLRHLLWVDRAVIIQVTGDKMGNAPYEIRGLTYHAAMIQTV